MSEPKKLGKIARLMLALSAYFALDKEQKNIILNRRIEDSHTPLYWVSFLEKIIQFDAKADSIRPIIGNFSAFLLGFGGFISICAATILLDSELYTIYFIVQGILLILMFIGLLLLIIYLFLKSRDIPNYVRTFIMPLLVILNEEMKAEELLHLQIDLRKKDRKDNEIDRQTNYKEGWTIYGRILVIVGIALFSLLIFGIYTQDESYLIMSFIGFFIFVFLVAFSSFANKYPRILHTTHLFPWLSAQGKLHDGTRLDINLTDEVHKFKITRSKRGSSGKTKIKTKIKYKVRTTYQVNLALPTHKYDLAHDLQAASRGLRNIQGVKIKNRETTQREVVKVNARVKTKELNYNPDLYQFLGWITNAYQQFVIKKEA
jgi:hypothetical protein